MRVTILGCGGASGTPSVEWGWGRCDPANPRNRRLRPAILVEEGETAILVDTPPDLREQFLRAGVRHLDAVLVTHAHADHLHGIDDLRPINRRIKRPLDLYADRATLEAIRQRFAYVLEPLAPFADVYYKPVLVPHEVKDRDCLQIGRVDITVFEQDHGYCKSLGFRIGRLAYSTDVVELPDHAFEILEGVDTWIVGTLVDKPHPTHAHLEKALGWIALVRPRRAVLTHLSGQFDYDALAARLPSGVEPAFDGMIIDIP